MVFRVDGEPVLMIVAGASRIWRSHRSAGESTVVFLKFSLAHSPRVPWVTWATTPIPSFAVRVSPWRLGWMSSFTRATPLFHGWWGSAAAAFACSGCAVVGTPGASGSVAPLPPQDRAARRVPVVPNRRRRVPILIGGALDILHAPGADMNM